MADIVTLDQIKSRLNLDPSDPSDDDELGRLANVATGVLRSITGGPLFTETITDERVRSDSDLALILRQRPLVSVTAIKAVWSGVAMTISDLDIDYQTNIVRRRSQWPFMGGTGAYLVTYTAGWGATAEDNPVAFSTFQEAALVIVGHMWEIQSGPGTAVVGWAEGTVMPSAHAPFLAGAAFAVPNRVLEIMRSRDPATGLSYMLEASV